MTRSRYNNIELGTSFATVEKSAGDPYAVHQLPSGALEYEYIERFDTDRWYALENHYFVIVEGGVVVGKRWIEQDVPPTSPEYIGVPNFYP